MVLASQLRPGMAIRHDGHTYKVISALYHAGQGKMGGVTHVRLQSLSTGTFREQGFRADLKLDQVPVEKQTLQYLYSDADQCCFMNPVTYEQVAIPISLIGTPAKFLRTEMALPVEFVEGEPVSVLFPDIIEVGVAETAPPTHGQQDSTWKTARIENGLEVMVPQFIRAGDSIRLQVETMKYVDRVRSTAR